MLGMMVGVRVPRVTRASTTVSMEMCIGEINGEVVVGSWQLVYQGSLAGQDSYVWVDGQCEVVCMFR